MESLVVSAILLVSFLLFFKMLGHFTLLWKKQESSCEKTATARYVLSRVNDLIFMAGYRPSVRAIHSMEPSRLALEYYVDGAASDTDLYSRHRLYTIFQDGRKLKLLTQRRRLPLDGHPRWSSGATTVMAEDVGQINFSYYDSQGKKTDVAEQVRAISYTFKLNVPGDDGATSGREQCYRSSVYLRNCSG